MTKDKIDELIAYKPGTVMPCEYSWQEQFAFDDEISPFVQMDVGKVRGLAIALQSLQKQNDIDADFIKQYQTQVASLQGELEEAKEVLKDLGRISVPVELYRLSGVAKRAMELLEKMEKGNG